MTSLTPAFPNIFLYEKFLASAQKAVVHVTLGPIFDSPPPPAEARGLSLGGELKIIKNLP